MLASHVPDKMTQEKKLSLQVIGVTKQSGGSWTPCVHKTFFCCNKFVWLPLSPVSKNANALLERFRNCFSCVQNCDDHLCLQLKYMVSEYLGPDTVFYQVDRCPSASFRVDRRLIPCEPVNRAPFLERPGNLTGPKSYFKIKVLRKVGCVLTSNEVHFVSSVNKFTVSFSKLLKLPSLTENDTT